MSVPIRVTMTVAPDVQPVSMRAAARNNPIHMDLTNAVYGTGGRAYTWGTGLKYDDGTNTVSVDSVDDAIAGEVRPITSNGVHKEIGNIAIALGTI